ncbi:MAG: hypothetical protein ACYCTY_08375 [Sulfuricella sp.]
MSLAMLGCSSTVRGVKTLAPTWFGFVEISKDIYVNVEMPPPQRIEVLKTVNAAQARVSQFFGGLDGHPRIFACSSEKCFVTNGHGATPKGQAYGSSALMLSPSGLNVVIISHELTHIELHTRVGAFRSWRSIPAWFDEGLAVLVSQDPRYTEEAWLKATEHGRNIADLNALTWGKGSWLQNYGTARHAVGEWYSHAGHAGLIHLIAEVKKGEDFDSVLNYVPSSSASNPALQPTPKSGAAELSR